MIKSLYLRNFRPYRGEHTVEFNRGVTCVQGANRSGKTELVSAIAYAFYGGASNGSPFPTNGETDFAVSVTLDDGSIVTRGNDGAFLNGEATTHPLLTTYMTEQLGMNKDELLMTLWTLKGNVGGFLSLAPMDQKRMLIGMTRRQMDWETIAPRMQKVVYNLSTFITYKEGMLADIARQLEGINLDQIDTVVDAMESQVAEIKFELEQNEEAVAADYARKAELSKQIAMLTDQLERVRSHNNKVEQDTQVKLEVKKTLHDIETLLDKMPSEPTLRKRCKEVTELISRIDTETERLSKYLTRYKKTNGMCPVMEEQCPYGDKLNCLAKTWEETLDNLSADMDNASKKRAQAESELGEQQELLRKSRDLRARLLELKPAEKETEPDASNLANWMDEMDEINVRLNAINRNQLIERLASAQERLNVLLSTKESYYQLMRSKQETENILGKCNDKLKEMSVAAALTRPMGLPYRRTFAVMEKLELYANTYLNLADINIAISPFRMLRTFASHCPVDGVEYLKGETECRLCRTPRPNAVQDQIEIITERGTTLSQESSGLRVLVSLALRFALYETLQELQAGKRCQKGLLVLDEVFGYLDDDNKINCLSMVQLAKEKLGIDQVIIISNVDGLPDIDNWLTIQRNSQGSVIERSE